ncbi:MAG TPA: SDR family oxidoreductase [Anaerolineales bacterium]|nr:SDR family oxidoreductase [Anaerolineales bacterium]
MDKCLVTGGAGFIGSHVVHALEAGGASVRVLDNLSTGSRANLEGSSAELVIGDITDGAIVAGAVDGVDVVFHLAAMISVPASMQDPRSCYQTNVIGSLNLLEAARKAGVRRVVLSSSCAVYGDSPGPSAETDPPDPRSPYAASKVAMEDLGRLYTSAFGLSSVSLRYFNVYGPRQSPSSAYAAVIPAFIQALLKGRPPLVHGDGSQSRDFVYVEDVAQANLLAACLQAGGPPVVNIGTGRSQTILELANLLHRLLPGEAPVFGPARAGDLHASCSDTRLAQEALGFRPTTAMERGLQRTVEWMRGGTARMPTMPARDEASG